ncbi:MAG: Tex family protein [Bacilli bacterium]
MNINQRISDELNLKLTSVDSAVKLLDEGNTVPFIARYRKEATGNLTDVDLRNLEERLIYLRNLDEREQTVLKSIEEQGKLTDELKDKILNAATLSEVEDLYRPYKPKKKTRGSIAREKGLVPLAKTIKEQVSVPDFEEYVKSFINEEKKVNTKEDALNGALDIISEDISDVADYRKYIKLFIFNNGLIVTKEAQKDEKDTYAMYADYKETIKSIPAHRILAINRGEKEKCLKVKLDYHDQFINDHIAQDVIKKDLYKEYLHNAIDDSLKRLILPSVENEIRSDLFSKAEDKSIEVFKKNLFQLLMYPPVKGRVILGFDPGFRTGCKYALVDKNGVPSLIGHSFITANSSNEVERSVKEITNVLKNNKIDYIALGNGTASRESEVVLNKIIKDNNFDTKIFIVNESGASVYSASKLGEQEFPKLAVEERSAISLARRVQDPLAELVKIDPKAIGVGQYQHDMDEKKLDFSLSNVVQDAVNDVGININTASVSLLNYVSGISKSLSKSIYDYRVKNKAFLTREEFKKVKGMGEKAFEQCAGFLRIIDGKNPLDNTSVHPESYDVANKIIKLCSIDLVKDSDEERNQKLDKFNSVAFMQQEKIGQETLKDIIEELRKPGRDIRDEVKLVELNNDVKDIKDLKVGMILNGTVRNIMDFGIFVDINVHQDGLVHISELANHFVKDPGELFNVNDIVKVKVIGVDVAKKRISLSIKQVEK